MLRNIIAMASWDERLPGPNNLPFRPSYSRPRPVRGLSLTCARARAASDITRSSPYRTGLCKVLMYAATSLKS